MAASGCVGGAGHCASCTEPIGDQQAIFANANLYHVRHWRCDVCNGSMDINERCSTFDERVRAACERCTARLCAKCDKCNRAMMPGDVQVIAGGRTTHRECFQCSRCHKVLTKVYYLDSEQRPLDKDCWWGQLLVDYIVSDPENVVPET